MLEYIFVTSLTFTYWLAHGQTLSVASRLHAFAWIISTIFSIWRKAVRLWISQTESCATRRAFDASARVYCVLTYVDTCRITSYILCMMCRIGGSVSFRRKDFVMHGSIMKLNYHLENRHGEIRTDFGKRAFWKYKWLELKYKDQFIWLWIPIPEKPSLLKKIFTYFHFGLFWP